MCLQKVITLLLFLFYTFLLPAQKISGFVRDSTGVVVSYASVVATSCRDELVLAYTTTNDNGAFHLSLSTDCDSITLTARSLGYRTTAHKISLRVLPLTVDFALAATVLQEVVIRAKTPPVIVRNDTTEFNAASFSDSTEFSVEDLLKKLPGVQVSEGGQISYNGKTVERVLIEGDDLFSQNYQIATRNVRADMISKVQVIDRYEENPVLSSIRKTDRMVMNLKIKPERKRTLSGSVTGGLGYGDGWKARGHTNLFSLSRKDKAYLIGTGNNTGKTASQSLGFPGTGSYFEPDKQELQGNPLRANGLVQIPPMERVGLPIEYTNTNRSGMIYLGEVIPITPQFKVKFSAWAGKDKLRQETTNATRILLESSVLDIIENKETTQRLASRVLQTEFEFFAPNKKHAIRSFIKIGDMPAGGSFQLLRSQTGNPDTWVTNLNDHKTKEAFASLEYTYKINAKTALQIIGKSAWYTGSALLNPNYSAYSTYFGLDSTFTNLFQNVGQRQRKSLIFARILSNYKRFQWVAETGIVGNSGKITSDIRLENPSGTSKILDDAAYRNDFQLLSPNYFASLQVSREFGKLKVLGQVYERFQILHITAPNIASETTKCLITEPSLNVFYKFNEKASLGSDYRYQLAPPNISSLVPAFLFTNYQTFSRGLPSLDYMPGSSVGLNYFFNNRQKQFSWNAGGSFKQNKNQFGGQYQISPVLSIQEKFRPVENSSYVLRTNASRFLSTISCRFELGASIFQLRETALINSDAPRRLNTTVQNLNLSFGTAFDTWVNVILDTGGSFSSLKSSTTTNAASLRAANLFSTFQIKVRPSKKFDLKLFVRHAANQLDKNRPYRHFFAADGVAYFRFPAWHSNLDISAFNLLGTRKFEQVSADAFYRNSTAVQAVNPFFVLSWDYSF